MFRATALESRFPLNMNVLDATRTPRVMALREVLRAWLDHRHEVLVRRSNHRLAAIERRIEVLDGYLLVYLNLDEVIRIIREEDQPKPRLMRRFELTDMQAEAILNMRLRSLRKLEEMEIRREHKSADEGAQGLAGAAGRTRSCAGTGSPSEMEETREQIRLRPAGRSPHRLGVAPAAVEVTSEAFIEREPITVILSEKGWIRAVQRRDLADPGELKFKEGDKLRLLLPCETTDRLMLFATNGRAFTLKAGDLPRGRGDGQAGAAAGGAGERGRRRRAVRAARGQRAIWSPPAPGAGFWCKAAELAAEKRTGKQVLNLKPGEEAMLCTPAEGDHVAVIGENRKLLVFPLDQVPELARGAGVQSCRDTSDGGAGDAKRVPAGRGAELAVRANAPAPRPICASGSASAPRPGATRRTGFRAAGSSGEVRDSGAVKQEERPGLCPGPARGQGPLDPIR